MYSLKAIEYLTYSKPITSCAEEYNKILMIPLCGLQIDVKNGIWVKQDGYYDI